MNAKFNQAGLLNPDEFKTILPQIYFDRMDYEDFRDHEMFIDNIRKERNKSRFFRLSGDIEEFIIQKYDYSILKKNILKSVSDAKSHVLFYRLFPNSQQDFILTSFYPNIENSKRKDEFIIPDFALNKDIFLDENGNILKNVHVDFDDDNSTKIIIRAINMSHNTLISNLIETFLRHKLDLSFMEVWQIKKVWKKVDIFYEIECHTGLLLSAEEKSSLADDFHRYLQSYIKAMSIFDMVGPSMLGPSSSHTAGANRIGQIARNIMAAMIESGEKIADVEVKLIGSFRDTGLGHKTPSAIGGGLLGYATDHPEMIVAGDPDNLRKNGICIGNSRIEFRSFTKGTADDDKKYLNQKNNNIAEVIVRTAKSNHIIAGFSIGAGNVEVRYFDKYLEKPIDGKTDMYLINGEIIPTKSFEGEGNIVAKIYHEDSSAEMPEMPFNTFEELDEYLNETNISIIDLIYDIEAKMQNSGKDEIFKKMSDFWQIMKSSVEKGVAGREMSFLKLSGKDANNINSYLKSNILFDNLYGRAVAYSTAVNEINARSGLIIACPTAGSCGILPGVLKAYCDFKQPDEKLLIESLMLAGFFGMILFSDVSTAGADYGCQAEIGAAAAMAASSLTFLEGGTPNEMIHAFVLALKNSLGLICDPIAGLVEVPCVKRNGIYSSLAISSALMALSGVKSFVSPDEVVLTMREVGERLHIDYKETGRAGLAKTRDGKEVEKDFEASMTKFFQ